MFAKFYKLLVRNQFYKGLFVIGSDFYKMDKTISTYFGKDIVYIDPIAHAPNIVTAHLSHIEKESELFIYNDHKFNGECEFNANRNEYKNVILLKKEKVRSITLDQIKNPEEYNFCIIDVNGKELDVIKGGEDFLQKIEYLCVRIHYSNLFLNKENYKNVLNYLSTSGWALRDTYIRDSDHVYMYFTRLSHNSKYYATIELEGNLGTQLFQIFFIYNFAQSNNLQLIFSDVPYYPNFNGLTYSPILEFFMSNEKVPELEFQVIDDDEYEEINFHTVVSGSFSDMFHPIPFQNIKYKGTFNNHELSIAVRDKLVQVIKQNKNSETTIKSAKRFFINLNSECVKLIITRGVSIGEYLEYKFCVIHICREISRVVGNADLDHYKKGIQWMKEYFKKKQEPTQLVFVLLTITDNYIPNEELYSCIQEELSQDLYIEKEIIDEYEGLFALTMFDAYILNTSGLDYMGWFLNPDYNQLPIYKVEDF